MTNQSRPVILMAVTAEVSLRLMAGFPAYLAAKGWDVHVVSSPGPNLDRLGEETVINIHPLPMKRHPSPLADFVALVKWIGLLRRIRPDVVSVGTPKAALLGGIAAWTTGVRHRVYMLRGLRLETSTGAQRAVLTAMEKLSIRAAHEVLSVSASLRQRAIELHLVAPEKIRVLGAGSSNGVDLGAFTTERFAQPEIESLKRSLGIVDDVPVIGFVGRLAKDKGLDVFADALVRLSDAGVEYQVLVVGGNDGAPTELRRATPGSQSPIMVGQVDDSAIYYRLMDVLCLPTLREGFPNVVLEAAASGVPAVTTTATGAVDSVVHGRTGLIAEVRSAEDLARKLGSILTDSELRAELGEAARQWVATSFARPQVWSGHARFYEQIMHPLGAS